MINKTEVIKRTYLCDCGFEKTYEIDRSLENFLNNNVITCPLCGSAMELKKT